MDATKYNQMGYQLYKGKKYNEANTNFNKAIELNPDFDEAYLNKGLVFKSLNNKQQAFTFFQKAISLNPKNFKAYNLIGLALKQQQKYYQAINNFDKAIEYKPDDYRGYNNKGITLKQLNKNKEAIYYYNKAIELDPTNHTPYLNKAIALKTLGEIDQSFQVFKKVINLDSRNGKAYYHLSTIEKQKKNYKSSLDLINKAIQIDPTENRFYNQKAIILIELKRYQQSLSVLDFAISLNPKDSFAYAQKGIALKYIGLYQQAVKVLQIATNLNQTDTLSLINKGLVLMSLREYNLSLLEFQKAISLQPTNYAWYKCLGAAYLFLERYSQAQTTFNKAINLNPGITQLYQLTINRGISFTELSNYQQANFLFQNACKIDPNRHQAYNYKGINQMLMDESQNALNSFIQAINRQNKNGFLFCQRAWSYFKQDLLAQSHIDFLTAVKIFKKDKIIETYDYRAKFYRKFLLRFDKIDEVILQMRKYRIQQAKITKLNHENCFILGSLIDNYFIGKKLVQRKRKQNILSEQIQTIQQEIIKNKIEQTKMKSKQKQFIKYTKLQKSKLQEEQKRISRFYLSSHNYQSIYDGLQNLTSLKEFIQKKNALEKINMEFQIFNSKFCYVEGELQGKNTSLYYVSVFLKQELFAKEEIARSITRDFDQNHYYFQYFNRFFWIFIVYLEASKIIKNQIQQNFQQTFYRITKIICRGLNLVEVIGLMSSQMNQIIDLILENSVDHKNYLQAIQNLNNRFPEFDKLVRNLVYFIMQLMKIHHTKGQFFDSNKQNMDSVQEWYNQIIKDLIDELVTKQKKKEIKSYELVIRDMGLVISFLFKKGLENPDPFKSTLQSVYKQKRGKSILVQNSFIDYINKKYSPQFTTQKKHFCTIF